MIMRNMKVNAMMTELSPALQVSALQTFLDSLSLLFWFHCQQLDCVLVSPLYNAQQTQLESL